MCQKNELVARLQKKQLEMLHELDRVCKICEIKYFLSSGTCLGALRHNGFIPWDDDVDVYMYWEDAEKLVKNQKIFKDNYFVQNRFTDAEITTTHYRLRDSNTCMILEEDDDCDINHGIFIDIYILYPYPDNKFLAQIVIWLSFLYRILQSKSGPKNHGRLPKLIGDVIAKSISNKMAESIKLKIENKYKHNNGKRFYATYFGRDVSLFRSIVYPQEWFKKPKYLDFEDMKVPCPGDVESYCKLQYGDTYMELPPIEKQSPHHDFVFVDTENSYAKFKGKYYNCCKKYERYNHCKAASYSSSFNEIIVLIV